MLFWSVLLIYNRSKCVSVFKVNGPIIQGCHDLYMYLVLNCILQKLEIYFQKKELFTLQCDITCQALPTFKICTQPKTTVS